MVPKFSKIVYVLTFVVMGLAAVAVQIAASFGRDVLQSGAVVGFWVTIAAVVSRFVPAPIDPRRHPPVWVFGVLVAVAFMPYLIEPLRRSWTGDGYPLELLMLFGLRNMGFALAAFGRWLLCLRLACVTSLFLVLFASTMCDLQWVTVVVGLYAVIGSLWLILVYWMGLGGVLVGYEKAVSVEVLPHNRWAPWLGLGALTVLLGGAVSLAVVAPKWSTLALAELMPTSGGTGETDPFARYGIGDGPQETVGNDPIAAGMVETDKMIEDNRNSLLDALNDMYGPPHKPRKEHERMIAVGVAEIIQSHDKLPESRRPSRDFHTGRKGPKGDRKRERRPDHQGARGLFEVQGRTPLHIRVVAYENYDSDEHCWREAGKPNGKWLEPEGGDWMRVAHLRDVSWYLVDDRHRLKAADMKSNLVPTPAMTVRFRIDKADRADYYEWQYDGVLALAGRKTTPPGVIVTTVCRTLDPARLPPTAFGSGGVTHKSLHVLMDVPDEVRREVARLASQWIGDRPQGWPQVEAILQKLRTDYALDRGIGAPAGHPAPVLWFLSESRRGPDYLFATAAALLLRTLDYPTRVCLGYYAAPEAYDPETAHTPVRHTDLHFWPEILLADGHWLVIEPTPGYYVLPPLLPLSERILRALYAGWFWARHNLVELVVLIVLLVVAWFLRLELVDAVAVWLWIWFPGASWQEQVRRALAILERRGRWAHRARHCHQTFRAWLDDVSLKAGFDADLGRLTRMAEWAAYAPDVASPWSQSEVRDVCRRVLSRWSLRRWRARHGLP